MVEADDQWSVVSLVELICLPCQQRAVNGLRLSLYSVVVILLPRRYVWKELSKFEPRWLCVFVNVFDKFMVA